MLRSLYVMDFAIVGEVDLAIDAGLTVVTGETGAGKSILLDAFALALGGRGDATLVRHGAEQGQVTATFDVPKNHPAAKILADNGLDDTGEMILRRVQLADGRTRAFINDQSISVQTLNARWSTHRRTAACSTPMPAWKRTLPPSRRCGKRDARPPRRWRNIVRRWSARRARRIICAMPPRN